jgi:Helix-hairpin-helix motif
MGASFVRARISGIGPRNIIVSPAFREGRRAAMSDKFEHDHPGQREPRAHGEIHHENRIVDLNTALEEELADLPMIGPKRARAICRNRPFKSWGEVEALEGFDLGLIDDLKSGGAQIGGPGGS